jgi:chemotaxis protein methyltransferase CheR
MPPSGSPASLATAGQPTKRETPVDSATWIVVQQFMRRQCGVVLRDDQSYLLESRLSPAAKQHGHASIAEYVAATCRGAAITPAARSLIEAMTTHETMFYRDAAFWQTFEQVIIPKLALAVKGGTRPKIWSAACSTGQEPYSIAMMLEERAPGVASSIEMVATDVAELSIARAREGIFTPLEVNRNVNAARLMKHFVQAPGGFRVRDEIRNRVRFQTHNLLGANADPDRCDVVLCRNVLIYFDDTDRAAVLRRLNAAAKTDGYIGIGSTETWREGRNVAPGWYQREKTTPR